MERLIAMGRKLLFIGIFFSVLMAVAVGLLVNKTTSKNTAYEQGIIAAKEGMTLEDNPFPPEKEGKHESWKRGFEGEE